MNYLIIYENLINNRKQNIPESYVEKHHIIPKCLGGTNDKENIVKFTAREHFIAHQLLAKIYKTEGLIYAAFRMSSNKKYGSKQYAWLKELRSINLTKKQLGTHRSEETKKKLSEINTGNIRSEESKQKQSKSCMGNQNCKGFKHSEESNKKKSERTKGRPSHRKGKHLTEEHIKNRDESRIKNAIHYEIISPTGIRYIETNLTQFCILNSLTYRLMKRNVNCGEIVLTNISYKTINVLNTIGWSINIIT